MKKILTLFVAVLAVTGFGQSLGDLKELGKDLIIGGLSRQAASRSTRDFQASLGQSIDQINTDRAKENEDDEVFRLPNGATLAFEVIRNDSGETDEAVRGMGKAALQRWSPSIRFAPSFAEREALAERNQSDRDNAELRNPTPKGKATRASWDVEIAVTRKEGFKSLSWGGSLFERTLFRLAGISASFDESQQITFYEVEISFKESDTQETPAGGNFDVVGCDTSGYSVHFDAETNSFGFGYSRTEEDNLANGLRDAFKRATAIYQAQLRKH